MNFFERYIVLRISTLSLFFIHTHTHTHTQWNTNFFVSFDSEHFLKRSVGLCTVLDSAQLVSAVSLTVLSMIRRRFGSDQPDQYCRGQRSARLSDVSNSSQLDSKLSQKAESTKNLSKG